MTTEATLIIDGVDYFSIEFVAITTVDRTESIATGRFWAAPDIIAAAKVASELMLNDAAIVITGVGSDGSLTFRLTKQ